MKLYHFALFFVVIATGFFVSAQTVLVSKMQNESLKKTESDCLVAAVNAAVEVAFSGGENTVTAANLAQAEEVFFQTLAVLHEGMTDKVIWETWKSYVPCLVLFEERGYYTYCFVTGQGYQWSALIPYEGGQIPGRFFAETEDLLRQYHRQRFNSEKGYRMAMAGEGIWEQSIVPPCAFAVYAPPLSFFSEEEEGFLYAASGLVREAYYVTEDNYCHLPFCEKCEEDQIIACYTTQRESAEDGAMPCEFCILGKENEG